MVPLHYRPTSQVHACFRFVDENWRFYQVDVFNRIEKRVTPHFKNFIIKKAVNKNVFNFKMTRDCKCRKELLPAVDPF